MTKDKKSYWMEDQTGNFTLEGKDTFDPANRYVGIRMQQGVPLLDRDWNELEDIRRYEELMLRKWYIGNGTPDDGFRISAVDPAKNEFRISAGRCLVDGFEVVNEPQLSEPLFSVDSAGSEETLNEGTIPETLITLFSEHDIYFSGDIVVASETEGVWKITDNNKNYKFQIKKKEDTLFIYPVNFILYSWQKEDGSPIESIEAATDRTDLVYLDVWIKEIKGEVRDPPDPLMNPEDLNEETTVRHKLEWLARVVEKGQGYTEVPYHHYYRIAEITRNAGTTTISDSDIKDLREWKSFSKLNVFENGNVSIGTGVSDINEVLKRTLSIKTPGNGGVEGIGISYPGYGSWGLGIMGQKNSNPEAFTIEHLDEDNKFHTKLLVDKNGNVGIGTTRPVSKLHIHGNYHNDSTGGFMLDATDTTDPETYVLRINPFVVDNGKVGYQFQTKSFIGGTNIPLTFDNAGNVGIGIDKPTKGKLQVNGNIVSARESDGTNAGMIDWFNLSNNKRWHMTMRSGDNDKLQLYHHDGTAWSGPHLNVNPDGKVGIGTADPTSGKLQFGNELGNKIVFNDGGETSRYGIGLNSGNLSTFIPENGNFSIRNNGYNGTETFKVKGDGTLQIKMAGGGFAELTNKAYDNESQYAEKNLKLIMQHISSVGMRYLAEDMVAASDDILTTSGAGIHTAASAILDESSLESSRGVASSTRTVTGTSVTGTPVTGTPVTGTPVTGTPVTGTPVTGTPGIGTGVVAYAPANWEFYIGHTVTSLERYRRYKTNFHKKFSINQNGELYCAGSKTGYVVDHFLNRLGDTIEQGDVVVISKYQVSHYSGTDNNIPVPEVDLTDKAYDTLVCGIVASVVTERDLPYVEMEEKAQSKSKKNKKGKEKDAEFINPLKEYAAKISEDLDTKKVGDQQMGKMVTLGAFAHCKVDADIAPIEVGDLLTTSITKGHAQKVLEPEKAIGAIIGKALGALKKGKGKIPVLVMLQ